MNFAKIQKIIQRHSFISDSYEGKNGFYVVLYMLLGNNRDVMKYNFELLKKLEIELKSNTHLVDVLTNLDKYKKIKFGNIKDEDVLDWIDSGLLTTVDARVLVNSKTERIEIGPSDFELEIAQSYLNAMNKVSDSKMIIEVLIRKLSSIITSPIQVIHNNHSRNIISRLKNSLEYAVLNLDPRKVEEKFIERSIKYNESPDFYWIEDLKAMNDYSGTPIVEKKLLDKLKSNLTHSYNFYGYTIKKAYLMATNLPKVKNRCSSQIVFLGAPGFIVYFLCKFFKKNNISFVTISPPSGFSDYDPNKSRELYELMSGPPDLDVRRMLNVFFESSKDPNSINIENFILSRNVQSRDIPDMECKLYEISKRGNLGKNLYSSTEEFENGNYNDLRETHNDLKLAYSLLNKEEEKDSILKINECKRVLFKYSDYRCIVNANYFLLNYHLKNTKSYPEEIIPLMEELLPIFIKTNDPIRKATAHQILGAMHKILDNETRCIENYQEAKRIFSYDKGRKKNHVNCLIELSEAFYHFNKIDSAEKEIKKARKIIDSEDLFSLKKINELLIKIYRKSNKESQGLYYMIELIAKDPSYREKIIQELKHGVEGSIQEDDELINSTLKVMVEALGMEIKN